MAPSTPEQQVEPDAEGSGRLLEVMEARRAALDSAMWHVPALIVAGQAFLLQILTSRDVRAGVAIAVAVAGTAASITAGAALAIQRDRERWYGVQVNEALSMPPREKAPLQGWAFWLWIVTLGTFVVVDWVAIVATHQDVLC